MKPFARNDEDMRFMADQGKAVSCRHSSQSRLGFVANGNVDMECIYRCKTPGGLDDLLLSSDGETLTGVWFEGSQDAAKHKGAIVESDSPVFKEARRWLDAYFAGREPSWRPRYRIRGLTPFRKAVIDEMLKIPFGETTTYGDIAKTIAAKRGIARMSAQAVGGAVGWNPLCIVIPCHRVIGADGSLTGYGGGIANKRALLARERDIA